MTRGLSLSNPGNIRISDQHWLGKLTPSRDPDFETFDSIEHGIRAVAMLVLSYYFEHGLNTITGIISRYAPPSENNTASYIMSVCDRTGFDADAPLDLERQDELFAIVSAICDHEQGSAIEAVSADQFKTGISLALSTLTTN